MSITVLCALGIEQSHLVSYQNQQIHRDVRADLQALQQAASVAGFALTLASSYRSFARQLAIWNAKFQGQRPVLNLQNQPVNLEVLSELEKCHAIMLYSALPGSSRHHFGTDFDVFDKNAVDEHYRLGLTPDEYLQGGVFNPLNEWLSENMHRYGFYRPYNTFRGGVAPEPWHISHIAVSQQMQQLSSVTALGELLRQQPVSGQQTLLTHLDALYQRYVVNIDQP